MKQSFKISPQRSVAQMSLLLQIWTAFHDCDLAARFFVDELDFDELLFDCSEFCLLSFDCSSQSAVCVLSPSDELAEGFCARTSWSSFVYLSTYAHANTNHYHINYRHPTKAMISKQHQFLKYRSHFIALFAEFGDGFGKTRTRQMIIHLRKIRFRTNVWLKLILFNLGHQNVYFLCSLEVLPKHDLDWHLFCATATWQDG